MQHVEITDKAREKILNNLIELQNGINDSVSTISRRNIKLQKKFAEDCDNLLEEAVQNTLKNNVLMPMISWSRRYKSEKDVEKNYHFREGWSLCFIPKPKEKNAQTHDFYGLEIMICPHKNDSEIKGLKVGFANNKLTFEEINA